MKKVDFFLAIAVVAVVIAFGNLIITINKVGDIKTSTGLVTIGDANLTLESGLGVNFTTENVNWATGIMDNGCERSTLTTGFPTYCGNWTDNVPPLTLENIGNGNVTLNITANKNASDFIGGTAPLLQLMINDSGSESNSCPDPSEYTAYGDLNETTTEGCANLGYLQAEDSVDLNLNVSIHETADPGAKGVLLTATVTVI